MSHSSDHFQGKSVNRHIVEKFVHGINLTHEPHGIESSGKWVSSIDAARQVCLILPLLLMVNPGINSNVLLLTILILALAAGARSAWIAWSKLEKLHRMLEEERLEIEENREQERQELKALYNLKGFEEPLLSEICDVLMADSDRLLKVMLEEELGLALAGHEHPLTLGIWAFVGTVLAGLLIIGGYFIWPHFLLYWSSCLVACTGACYAYTLGNDRLHAWICHASGAFVLLLIAQTLSQQFMSL